MDKTCFFADTKPHYDILDGLRGVAALIVIVCHVFELYPSTATPHGFLAVDFFFILSGFVIGYAYDSRWDRMTVGGFFKRRLIRLHPMVIFAAVLGAVTFLLQGGVKWDGSHVGFGWVMLAMLMTMCMIPSSPGMQTEVRGNGEIFPLNGPSWSLFFEYIGNILYALLLRKLPKLGLAVLAVITGGLLAWISISNGCIEQGWTMARGGFWAGLVRMLFPYTMGMLMARVFRPMKIKGAFPLASLILILATCFPTLGGAAWHNGLYEVLCVILVFPAIVWMGASDQNISAGTKKVCRFLGDLSYPLYIIHYPLFYLYYAYIGFDGSGVSIPIGEAWPVAIGVSALSILLAWLCMRFYDMPLRKRLSRTLI